MGRQRRDEREGPHVVGDPHRPGAMLLRVGATDQSYVDLSDPLHLEFDYMARMADVIRAWRPAGERIRVTHIGGGAMTMPRYLAATRPTSPQIVFEPDEAVVAIVRDKLPLPTTAGVRVRPTDGRTGLAALGDRSADLVIIDAFVAGRVPASVATVECFNEVARVLAPDGLFLMNLTDMAPFTYVKAVVAGVMPHWSPVLLGALPATWRGRRSGNVVLAATAAPIDVHDLTRYSSAAAFPYRWQVTESSWCAGLPALLDADEVDSPDLGPGKWLS